MAPQIQGMSDLLQRKHWAVSSMDLARRMLTLEAGQIGSQPSALMQTHHQDRSYTS
jgi:hypothetical protein